MDEIDAQILQVLQSNARMTASQISTKISLSVPAVCERLKKLDASGIIKQYTTIINPSTVGKNLMAMMLVTLENARYHEKFAEYIQEQDEVLECYYLAGDYDYYLKIVTSDTASLESLLNQIKYLSGVVRTQTTIILSTIKQKYSVFVKAK